MSRLYALKPEKDRLLGGLSRALCAAGVTPNMVTATGFLLSVAAGLLAMAGHLDTGILVFLLAAGLDAVDGSLARSCGLASEFGRYFDSACDRLSEIAFCAGAVLGGAPSSVFIVVAGSLLLFASRVYRHLKGLDSNAATFGRPERLGLLVVGLLCPAPLDTLVFIVAGFLCLVSSVQALTADARAMDG